jgi:hypothetical protein
LANTKIYPGLKSKGKGPTPAIILSIVFDRILKRDSDPITVSELCSETSETPDRIVDALRELDAIGRIRFTGAPLEEAGSFSIKGFAITMESDQMAFPRDEPQPDEGMKANDLAANPRLDTGDDDVDRGNFRYFGHVEYNGETGGGHYQLGINRLRLEVPDPENEDVFFGDFDSKEDAWRFFDNFVSKDSRDQTQEMVYAEPSGEVWRCELEFKPKDQDDADSEEISVLKMYFTGIGDDTSTLKVEEKFDTESEAWNYADEYLKPVETEAEPVALEVVDGGERSPTVSAESNGVKWRYFGQDGKKKGAVDRFEFDTPEGTQSKELPSKDVLADGRSIEEIALAILEELSKEPVA